MAGPNNLTKHARKSNWYRLVSREMERHPAASWDLLPPTGKGHPKLIVEHAGKTMKTPVPSSERPGGCHKYLVARIRRFMSGIEVSE